MANAALGGIRRWFPRGLATEGVDWPSLDEHLSMVPDIAFEVVMSQSNARSVTDQADILPSGVSALHLTVACSNPAAPLSLVQKLIDANPDALYQTAEKNGWNVLHCALFYNRHLRVDHGVVDLLIQANPALASGVSKSCEEEFEFGLPPLALANCKEVVPSVFNAMPTKMVIGVLKTIFARRKLLGGSIGACEQIIKEISALELRQGRPILETGGITPKNKSLIQYALSQASLRSQASSERNDLMRLADLLIQATYCLKFQKDDGGTTISNAPPALQCLKTLVLRQKTKQKALQTYQSLQEGSFMNENYINFLEPDHDLTTDNRNDNTDSDHAALHGQPTREAGQPTASLPSSSKTRQEKPEKQPAAVNTFLKQLLSCKIQLDRKMDKSLDTLKQTANALEGYRTMYSDKIDRLCEEAQNRPSNSQSSSRRNVENSTDATHMAADLEENMASIRAVVALSSIPAQSLTRPPLEDSIQEAIENMKVISHALDRCNQKFTQETEILIQEQADHEDMDLSFFRTTEHRQGKKAVEELTECQIEKEGVIKRIVDIESQRLKSKKEVIPLLNMNCGALTIELGDANRKIKALRDVVSSRRIRIAEYVFKARKILNSRTRSQISRSHARRFLQLARAEMREIIASLSASKEKKTNKPKRASRRIQKKKQEQEGDEELTRMTKRMKL